MNRDFLVTVIAVSSFAGLGCFIRTGLGELFGPWNLLSLLPNIVGTFVLGIIKGLSLKNKYINTGLGTVYVDQLQPFLHLIMN